MWRLETWQAPVAPGDVLVALRRVALKKLGPYAGK